MEPPPQEEEITEEQRKRIEANRQAALAKRKAKTVGNGDNNNCKNKNSNPIQVVDAWRLFKCRKLSSEPSNTDSTKPIYPFVKSSLIPMPQLPLASPSTEKFRVRLEICSPDSFSITPEPVPGFAYPGEEACFGKISLWLSDVCVFLFALYGIVCVLKMSVLELCKKVLFLLGKIFEIGLFWCDSM